jgi:hypothetical protein
MEIRLAIAMCGCANFDERLLPDVSYVLRREQGRWKAVHERFETN